MYTRHTVTFSVRSRADARRARAHLAASGCALASAALFSTAFWLPLGGTASVAVVVAGCALAWLGVAFATIGGR